MSSQGPYVIPAKAGIQNSAQAVDSRLRGNDDNMAAQSDDVLFSTEQSHIS